MSRGRLRARADRVKEEADLGELLAEWGYMVVPDRQREQQFSCDLHGPDHKPSARYYGLSNSTYCWVCQVQRDAIQWVMEKEMLDFRGAIEHLEDRLGLPPLPWDDDRERRVSAEDEVAEASVRPVRSYEQERDRLRTILRDLTDDRQLARDDLLAFWEVFDRIDYGIAKQNWEEAKGASATARLRERVMEKVKAYEDAQ